MGQGVFSVCVKITQGDGETIKSGMEVGIEEQEGHKQVSQQNQCAHLYLLTVRSSPASVHPAVTMACFSMLQLHFHLMRGVDNLRPISNVSFCKKPSVVTASAGINHFL